MKMLRITKRVPENKSNQLLSRAEVADRLSVCPQTVQRLTRQGRLPAKVFSRQLVRYDIRAVEDFIASADHIAGRHLERRAQI